MKFKTVCSAIGFGSLSLRRFELREMFLDGSDFSFQILEIRFQLRDPFRARRKAPLEFLAVFARAFAFATVTFAAVMLAVSTAVTLTIACVLTTFALTFAVLSAVSVTITTASAVAMLFVTFTHFSISFETDVISRVELLHQ